MAKKYNPVTPELLNDLRNVLGEKYVKTDDDYLTAYQTDEEGNSHFSINRKSLFSQALQKKSLKLLN